MPTVNGTIVPGLGPLIDIWVGLSAPRCRALKDAGQTPPTPVRVRALLDTGASGTCVDEQVIAPLHLVPTGMIHMHTPSTAGTPHLCPQYDIGVGISAAPDFHMMRFTLPILAVALRAQNIDALIGRDLLDDTTLIYNGPAKSFTWTM